MRYLTDSKTMKEVDTRAQEEIGIPGSVLMERAALAVAEAVQELIHLYGSRQKKEKNRILAVCGIGNNGGDGVAAARILYEWGYPAEFQIIGEERQGALRCQTAGEQQGIRQSRHRAERIYYSDRCPFWHRAYQGGRRGICRVYS